MHIGRNSPCPCGSGRKFKKCCDADVRKASEAKTPGNEISGLMAAAARHHRAGRLDLAEAFCKQLLDISPDHVEALHLLGWIALHTERHATAEELILNAIRLKPFEPAFYNSLGGVAQACGDLSKATELYNKVLTLDPNFYEAHYNLGNAARDKGNLDAAISHYKRALAINPRYFEAHMNLGVVLQLQGDHEAAIIHLKSAIAHDPRCHAAHYNLGNALKDQGNLVGAVEHYEKAIAIHFDYAEAHANLGAALMQQGNFSAAVEHHNKALNLQPGWSWVESNRQFTLRNIVPSWHFGMLNDKQRNQAFQTALSKAISKESIVLDIGTGSGLLAMMAAQAGAKHVFACEAVPLIANKAEQIIRKNGYSDKITMLRRKSTDIKLGIDLPYRANVIVSEIVDAGLLGEGILPTLDHARHHLADSQPVIIPRRAIIRAALIECPALVAEQLVLDENTCGYDLKLFNELSSQAYKQTNLKNYSYRFLSSPQQVFEFDFYHDIEKYRRRSITFTTTSRGVVHAVAFWFRLLLDDEIFMDTGPQGASSHWAQAVQLFGGGFSVQQDQAVELIAEHDLKTVFFRDTSSQTR